MFLYNDKHNRNRRKVSISKSNFSPNLETWFKNLAKKPSIASNIIEIVNIMSNVFGKLFK